MTELNLLRAVLEELDEFLRPILNTEGDPEALLDFLDQIGWHVRDLAAGATGSLPATVEGIGGLIDRALATARGGEIDLATIPQHLADLGSLFGRVRALTDDIRGQMPFDASDLPLDLLNALTVSYIMRRSPPTFNLLELATLVRRRPPEQIEHNGVVVRTKYANPQLELSRLVNLFTNPGAAFAEVYWPHGLPDAPEANAVARRFFPIVGRMLNSFVGIAQPSEFGRLEFLVGRSPGPSELPQADQERQERMMSFRWTQQSTAPDQLLQRGASLALIPETEGGPGVSVVPFGAWSITIPISDWLMALGLEGALGGLDITDSGVRAYVDPAGGLRLSVEVVRATSPELLRIGPDTGPRIDIPNVAISVTSVVGAGEPDIKVMLYLQEAVLVLNPGELDGFLQTIVPTDSSHATFSLGVGWSRLAGFHIEGSAAIQIRLPLHLDVGPITFSDLVIAALFKDGSLPIEAGVTICVLLGPLSAVVENVGLHVTASFPQGGGNIGPLDVSVGLKPPNGVGLSIDVGVVKGGGYLHFNSPAEEYAGALELTIAEFLSLKAIGLITTRMPDGSRGFSMIIIITAEFSPGIQLGYGFVLTGVGGLLGLNRTVDLEALALGVRTGAVNGILFPVDPVANATRIISDLRTIFPPLAGRFLIGPMAKLGWGTPTLVNLSLGIIIEIPGNVAILGVLKLALPDENAEILKLQVNFVGSLEIDKKRGWFFAALFELRLLFITLEGEMGLLIALGTDANFLLSAGGFHPRYAPPSMPFPSPRRISLEFLNTDNARIRAETYFAVTTNTVQFGARAELFFGFDAFSVEGHIALDALLRFSPFHFIVEITAGVSLKAFGVGVFNIDLELTLEGVTPWRARGRGSIKLLFFKISANFDHTWGDSRDTTLPPVIVLPLLQAELEKAGNWQALLPPSHNLLVSLRALELPGDTLVLHPLGALEVSQNAIPLGITLDRIGAQKPADADRLAISVKGDGGLVKQRDARRRFAPAQFRTMSDAQKLSAPAFQDEVAGVVISVQGAELRTARAVRRSIRYELTTIDTFYRRFLFRFSNVALSMFRHLVKGGAVSASTLSRSRSRQKQPFDDRMELGSDEYSVVFTRDNREATPGGARFGSEAEASEWIRRAIGDDPNLHGRVHVVPVTEWRRAA